MVTLLDCYVQLSVRKICIIRLLQTKRNQIMLSYEADWFRKRARRKLSSLSVAELVNAASLARQTVSAPSQSVRKSLTAYSFP